MKNNAYHYVIVAAMGIFVSALPNVASALSTPQITQAQLDSLHRGESRREIVKALGKPEESRKWRDGTRSLEYALHTDDGPQQASVNLDRANKMTTVQVLPR